MGVGRSAVNAGGIGALLAAAFLIGAPMAAADPDTPTPTPPVDSTMQAASAEPTPAAQGVPHLPSPEHLPPGTTDAPVGAPQGRGMSYLRELWHAIQTQDVSGGDALLLLTQRPLDANATPPPGMSAGPAQNPITPDAPAAP